MENNEKKSLYPGTNKDNVDADNDSPLSSGEQEVLKKLREGDPDAFREVFTRWEPLLHNYLYKLTGSPEDAEDISQVTFAKLWINRHKIDTGKNIRTYIFLIAQQLTWNSLRSRKRHNTVYTGELTDREEDFSFESRLDAQEIEMLTDYYIQKLPPGTRKVYLLHYKENLSYEEISSRLGISVNNVASHIFKARQRLKNDFILSAFIFLTQIIRF